MTFSFVKARLLDPRNFGLLGLLVLLFSKARKRNSTQSMASLNDHMLRDVNLWREIPWTDLPRGK